MNLYDAGNFSDKDSSFNEPLKDALTRGVCYLKAAYQAPSGKYIHQGTISHHHMPRH